MCNHVAKPNQTKTRLPAGLSLAPMEVDDRPCEAVLAGNRSWLRATNYATGGLGGQRCMLNFATPRPLCYFLRGKSRTIITKSLARKSILARLFAFRQKFRPAGRPKGFPIALWKPSGPDSWGLPIILKTFGPCGGQIHPSPPNKQEADTFHASFLLLCYFCPAAYCDGVCPVC